MAVRKIRNKWWVDFRHGEDRFRKKSPDNTRSGAMTYEATLRARLGRGEPLDGPVMVPPQTFAEFAQEWFTTYVITNNRPQEQRTKMCALRNHILPHFGDLGIGDVGAKDIERFKAKQLDIGLSAKSINNELSILRKCLVCAADWGHRQAVPVVQWLPLPRPVPRRLASGDLGRLIAAPTAPTWHAMIVLAARTGLRAGELLALQWDDIDVARRLLTVRHSIVRGVLGAPKNSRIRHVPLTPGALGAVEGLPRTSRWLFPDGMGNPVSYSSAAFALRRACRAAGIPRTSWHVLRHTFASELVDRHVPLRHVQELLGHSTIVMTERYAHLAPGSLASAVAVLELDEGGHAPREVWATGGQHHLPRVVGEVVASEKLGERQTKNDAFAS